MASTINMEIGQRFNRLILEKITYKKTATSRHRYGLFVCDCGKSKKILLNSVVSGRTKSCGCFKIQKDAESKLTTAKSDTPIYSRWRLMKQRCLNKKCPNYQRYGAKGIGICDEWMVFENFEKWALESGFEKDLHLDRIDNNGDYKPSNCRWITQLENNENRSNSRIWSVFGVEYHSAYSAAKAIGKSPNTVYRWCGAVGDNRWKKDNCSFRWIYPRDVMNV